MLLSELNRSQTAPHLIWSATCSSQTQDFLLQSSSSLPPHTANQDLDLMPRTSEDYVQVKPEWLNALQMLLVVVFCFMFSLCACKPWICQ